MHEERNIIRKGTIFGLGNKVDFLILTEFVVILLLSYNFNFFFFFANYNTVLEFQLDIFLDWFPS